MVHDRPGAGLAVPEVPHIRHHGAVRIPDGGGEGNRTTGKSAVPGRSDTDERRKVERNQRVSVPDHDANEVRRVPNPVPGGAIILCRSAAMVDAGVIRPIIPARRIARVPEARVIVGRLDAIEVKSIVENRPCGCGQLRADRVPRHSIRLDADRGRAADRNPEFRRAGNRVRDKLGTVRIGDADAHRRRRIGNGLVRDHVARDQDPGGQRDGHAPSIAMEAIVLDRRGRGSVHPDTVLAGPRVIVVDHHPRGCRHRDSAALGRGSVARVDPDVRADDDIDPLRGRGGVHVVDRDIRCLEDQNPDVGGAAVVDEQISKDHMGRRRPKEDAVPVGGVDVPALDGVRIPGASVPARDAVRRGEIRIRVDEDRGVGGERAPRNRSGRGGYGNGGEEDEHGEGETVASTDVNPHSACHDSRDAVLRFRSAL